MYLQGIFCDGCQRVGKACGVLVIRDTTPESKSIGSSSSSRMRVEKSPAFRLPVFTPTPTLSSSSLSLMSLSLAYNTSSNASPVAGFFDSPYENKIDTYSGRTKGNIALTSSLSLLLVARAFFLFARSFRFLMLTRTFAASSPLAHECTSWYPKRRIIRSKMCRTFALK